jgi:hypothetical protein
VFGEKRFEPFANRISTDSFLAATSDKLIEAATSKVQQTILDTPVYVEAVPAVASAADEQDARASLSRARSTDIIIGVQGLMRAVLQKSLEAVEQASVNQKAESRVQRVLLWTNLIVCIAVQLSLIMRFCWEIFHPASPLELILPVAANVVNGMGSYAAHRFIKGKSGGVQPSRNADKAGKLAVHANGRHRARSPTRRMTPRGVRSSISRSTASGSPQSSRPNWRPNWRT